MAGNDPALPGSLAVSVPQHHTTTSSGLTLRPPSPPSCSSHLGPVPSRLSLHNSATSFGSTLVSDTLAIQRQEILDVWKDAEGEIPVSRLWR